MTKLLPCPFCGGSATMEQTAGDRWSVGCDSADEPTCMGYQSFTTFARQGEASEAWNKRAAIQPQRVHDPRTGPCPTCGFHILPPRIGKPFAIADDDDVSHTRPKLCPTEKIEDGQS